MSNFLVPLIVSGQHSQRKGCRNGIFSAPKVRYRLYRLKVVDYRFLYFDLPLSLICDRLYCMKIRHSMCFIIIINCFSYLSPLMFRREVNLALNLKTTNGKTSLLQTRMFLCYMYDTKLSSRILPNVLI